MSALDQIRGHSIFSTKYYGVAQNGDGLPGLRIVSIEELDRVIDSIAAGKHQEWVDDYEAKKQRRVESLK